jgi:hypothetical protein
MTGTDGTWERAAAWRVLPLTPHVRPRRPSRQMLGAEMIQAGNHRPSPRGHGRARREARRAAPSHDAPDNSPVRRRITRRGWAILAAVATATILWGILIVSVAYFASHYSVAHGP